MQGWKTTLSISIWATEHSMPPLKGAWPTDYTLPMLTVPCYHFRSTGERVRDCEGYLRVGRSVRGVRDVASFRFFWVPGALSQDKIR